MKRLSRLVPLVALLACTREPAVVAPTLHTNVAALSAALPPPAEPDGSRPPPAAESHAAPKALTLRGTGKTRTEPFELAAGKYKVEYTLAEECYYSAALEASSGSDHSQLFLGQGPLASLLEGEINAGSYYVDVDTGLSPGCPWKVSFVPPGVTIQEVQTSVRMGMPVQFPDSEWTVQDAKNLGGRLESRKPLQDDASTDGKFVAIQFSVKNLGKSRIKIQKPKLVDALGREFASDEYDASTYLPSAKGMNRFIPPGMTRYFWALYELPLDADGLKFSPRAFEPLVDIVF